MGWLSKRRVAVPIDFSETSPEAILAGLEFAESPASMHVIHVLLPLDDLSPGVLWGEVDDQSREEAVRKHFEEFRTKHQIPDVQLVIKFGDPGTEITEYAYNNGIDLIVIPSHGYHGFKRFVLGSVAERVIRHANCPVLVLRRGDAQ